MAGTCGLSTDGKVLAGVEFRRHAATPVIAISVNGLPSGALVFKANPALTTGDYLQGPVCVAEDGSAVALTLFDSNDGNPRLLVARPGDANVVVPGYYRAVGIASAGTWALARPWASRSEDHPPVALLMAAVPPRLLTTAAMGPGYGVGILATLPPARPVAVSPTPGVGPAAPAPPSVTAQVPVPVPAPASPPLPATAAAPAATPPAPVPIYSLQLIKPNGSLAELPPLIGFSKSCRIQSLGRWVVIGSGYQATSPETTDLLGNVVVKGGQDQPFTTMFYRWSDLALEPAGAPALVIQGDWTVAANEVNAVYAFRDRTITMIDLTGNDAVERPFAQTPFTIGSLSCEAGLVKAREDEGTNWLVTDSAGHPLWTGNATSCDLFEPGWAVTASAGYQLIGLNEDAAKRTSVRLQVEGSGWDVTVDRFGRRALATKSGKWIECDPLTGKVRRTGTVAPPPVAVREQPDGRYRVEHARVVEKSVPLGSEDPVTAWAPQDAWRVGGTLLVLDHSSRIYMSGKRRSYSSLGTCDDADSFALLKDNLVVANDNDKVIGGFTAGPLLVTEFEGKGLTASEPLSSQLWHIKGLSFQPPRGTQMLWDPLKAGFTPRLLRCPPGALGLMAVTDSLIFDLDANIARQMGSPERPVP
jgi:hypothetical protein